METSQRRKSNAHPVFMMMLDSLRRPFRLAVVGVACLLALTTGAALAGQPESAVVFARTQICIYSNGNARLLDVELAETQRQRARGLMMRDSLAPESGMLFVYPERQSARSGFWMYQTRVPLDVAFLASDGTILRISAMAPCQESVASACPVFEAGQPFQAALEMSQGFYSGEGIREGDRIVLADSGECRSRD